MKQRLKKNFFFTKFSWVSVLRTNVLATNVPMIQKTFGWFAVQRIIGPECVNQNID